MKKEAIEKIKAKFPEIKTLKSEIKAEMKADGVLEIGLYGTIEPDYFDWWTDEEVKSETSARHFREILESHPDVKVINLHINSMGGYVTEGNEIYTLLKRHTATVNVFIDAFAASMASGIAMAGDQITMSPNALMMIHNPLTGAYGNSKELRKVADDLDVMGEAFRQMYLLKAGDKLEESKLIEMLDAETYLTAEQAKELGLCDVIAFVDKNEADKAEINALRAEIESLKAKLHAETHKAPQANKDQPKKTGWFFK